MKMKSLSVTISFLVLFLTCVSVIAQIVPSSKDKQYHEKINWLWSQRKVQYTEMVKKSGENPGNLYTIQTETNNLLKYAGYDQKFALINELSYLYLQALNTLIETDQYLYSYYPGSPRLSVHPLDKKYRMWADNQKQIGQESILVSSQFLYLLSDTVSIISENMKEKRTPVMQEALTKFIPLLIEHYNRWIFSKPGPFQVRGWGCRFDGKYVSTGMNHHDFLKKKLDKKLGNGKSPPHCNAVNDMDMWIIAGVANLLTVYQKEKTLVPINPEEYKKLLSYLKMGVKLLESRFSFTELKNLDGKPVIGAIFDAGAWDEHRGFAYSGYTGQDYPSFSATDKVKNRGKEVGWDLSHARRFVHVFETLLKSKDILGLYFPTKELLEKMANQLIYGTFNRDFDKPLFANFMDGTNGWYRVGFSGRSGFGYGPWDMSLTVFEGGYGFWSIYNTDIKKAFFGFLDMIESKDPATRKHVVQHYETNYWNRYKRPHRIDFMDKTNPFTQSVLIKFLPSLCLMVDN